MAAACLKYPIILAEKIVVQGPGVVFAVGRLAEVAAVRFRLPHHVAAPAKPACPTAPLALVYT